jgi:hypothetical protein
MVTATRSVWGEGLVWAGPPDGSRGADMAAYGGVTRSAPDLAMVVAGAVRARRRLTAKELLFGERGPLIPRSGRMPGEEAPVRLRAGGERP